MSFDRFIIRLLQITLLTTSISYANGLDTQEWYRSFTPNIIDTHLNLIGEIFLENNSHITASNELPTGTILNINLPEGDVLVQESDEDSYFIQFVVENDRCIKFNVNQNLTFKRNPPFPGYDTTVPSFEKIHSGSLLWEISNNKSLCFVSGSLRSIKDDTQTRIATNHYTTNTLINTDVTWNNQTIYIDGTYTISAQNIDTYIDIYGDTTILNESDSGTDTLVLHADIFHELNVNIYGTLRFESHKDSPLNFKITGEGTVFINIYNTQTLT